MKDARCVMRNPGVVLIAAILCMAVPLLFAATAGRTVLRIARFLRSDLALIVFRAWFYIVQLGLIKFMSLVFSDLFRSDMILAKHLPVRETDFMAAKFISVFLMCHPLISALVFFSAWRMEVCFMDAVSLMIVLLPLQFMTTSFLLYEETVYGRNRLFAIRKSEIGLVSIMTGLIMADLHCPLWVVWAVFAPFATLVGVLLLKRAVRIVKEKSLSDLET